MKITTLVKEGKRGVITLVVDDDAWRDIHTHIFGYKAFYDKCNDRDDLEAAWQKTELHGAKQYALRRLAAKSYLEAELIKKLQERLVSDNTIKQVIEECRHLGYLNDTSWLESFIRRSLTKNMGPQAILMKLRTKGISENVAREFLDKFDNAESEQERVRKLLETRYRTRDLSDFNVKQKVVASLMRKGFSYESIKNGLKPKDRHGNGS